MAEELIHAVLRVESNLERHAEFLDNTLLRLLSPDPGGRNGAAEFLSKNLASARRDLGRKNFNNWASEDIKKIRIARELVDRWQEKSSQFTTELWHTGLMQPDSGHSANDSRELGNLFDRAVITAKNLKADLIPAITPEQKEGLIQSLTDARDEQIARIEDKKIPVVSKSLEKYRDDINDILIAFKLNIKTNLGSGKLRVLNGVLAFYGKDKHGKPVTKSLHRVRVTGLEESKKQSKSPKRRVKKQSPEPQ